MPTIYILPDRVNEKCDGGSMCCMGLFIGIIFIGGFIVALTGIICFGTGSFTDCGDKDGALSMIIIGLVTFLLICGCCVKKLCC